MANDKQTTKSNKKDAEKDKKKGGMRKYFKELRAELKKVVWPTKQTVANNTSVVVGVIVLSAALVGALDEGFLALFRAIYH